jgi:hypothetical protein
VPAVAGRTRVSLWRYSPALVLFAIVIADARQLSDPDLWGHVLWGRDLLAHGSLPRGNLDSYSAPGFLWLHHEWLSEVLMASLFDMFGPFGLKLLKFLCTAGTISFIVLAESETGAPALLQTVILLIAAVILLPAMQFRPQIFDFLSLSAIVALLCRENWRGSAPLWIAIPMMAIWSNLHGGFFVGLVAMGVYGAAIILSGRDTRRGLRIIAITAAAAASTFCTFLIPPARDTWYTLVHSILNPTTHTTIVDWKPLLASLSTAPAGSIEQKYFVVVLLFFAAAIVSVILTPRGADAPLVAVAAVLLSAAFVAQRNIPIAAIAIAPVLAKHLSLLRRPHEVADVRAESTRAVSPTGRLLAEIAIAVFAIAFARHSGILSPGIDASGNPGDAVNFMNLHGLKGNVLADYGWGQFVIWHGAPGTKVFIDSRYDLGYPPTVLTDYMALDRGEPAAAHTLAAYPTDFVLLKRDWPSAKLMDSRPDWRLIYSDDVARLYAPANSPAAHLEGVVKGAARPVFFP